MVDRNRQGWGTLTWRVKQQELYTGGFVQTHETKQVHTLKYIDAHKLNESTHTHIHHPDLGLQITMPGTAQVIMAAFTGVYVYEVNTGPLLGQRRLVKAMHACVHVIAGLQHNKKSHQPQIRGTNVPSVMMGTHPFPFNLQLKASL